MDRIAWRVGSRHLGEIEWAIADDRRWRGIAARARAKAAAMMGGELVTDFILRMTLGQAAPEGWRFSDEIYLRPARMPALVPAPAQPSPALVGQYA